MQFRLLGSLEISEHSFRVSELYSGEVSLEPRLECDATIFLPSSEFFRVVKCLYRMSPTIRIEANGEGLSFSVDNCWWTGRIVLQGGSREPPLVKTGNGKEAIAWSSKVGPQ